MSGFLPAESNDDLLSGVFVCRHKTGSCFPISAYVSDMLDHCYSPDLPSSSTETPHKEEGVKRCKVDENDRQRIGTELGKCSHLLDSESGVLYNIHNGQVAPTMVNVSDSLALGVTMATASRNSLQTGLHVNFSQTNTFDYEN